MSLLVSQIIVFNVYRYERPAQRGITSPRPDRSRAATIPVCAKLIVIGMIRIALSYYRLRAVAQNRALFVGVYTRKRAPGN